MKRGSALLLVLGMLAIVVVSAVAFSAFMRYSRLPSSYLRQSSSSRMLVKAAVAEAIDIVDAAIADNPHPGVGYGTIRYPRGSGDKPMADADHTRNCWRNHVFTGSRRLVSESETVSTLSLEGLAYLPPALINEARYYSRHSTAAKWHSFGYDSGRFAFCAVDVSDHLDVNKIPANIGRGSSPENRFSLTHVFENADHTGYTLEPSDWAGFVGSDKYIPLLKDDNIKEFFKTPEEKVSSPFSYGLARTGSSMPFVSLADLNLAVNADGLKLRTYFPFVAYVTDLTDDYISLPTGPVAEMQKHMNFVADGHFPSAVGTGDDDDYDLSDDKYQPFRGESLKKNNARVIRKIIDKSSLGAERLRNSISRLGLVHLWDYLDEDDVPVSLSIPSVERTPMVCGIKPVVNNLSLKINKKFEAPADTKIEEAELEKTITADGYPEADKKAKPSGPEDTRSVTYVKKYVLDKNGLLGAIESGSIKAVVTYPFRRGKDLKDPDGFTIDGHVEFFLTTGDFKFRTGNQSDSLHFESEEKFTTAQKYEGNGVIHVPIKHPGDLVFDSAQKNYDEGKAVQAFDLVKNLNLPELGTAIDAYPVFTVTYSQLERAEEYIVGGEKKYKWVVRDSDKPTVAAAKCGLPPLGPDGGIDPEFADAAKLKDYLNGNGTKQATLRMAVYLRIKNSDGKTVDLVPACISDDKNFNNVENFNSMQDMVQIVESWFGRYYPVMRFDCGGAFPFNLKSFDDKPEVLPNAEVTPKGVMCADPRWNWAPENWYEFKEDNLDSNTWLDEVKKYWLGKDGRDPDIFMATSDAGYLQSVYELAFLPRLVDGSNSDDGFKPDNELYGSLDRLDEESGAGGDGWAASFSGVKNANLMWRTYRPFAYKDDNGTWDYKWSRDPFEDVGFVSDGNGMKVNPYAGTVTANPGSIATGVDATALMPAFANTPESWWAASANVETGVSMADRKAQEFNTKYALSNMNAGFKLDWYDLVTKSGDSQDMEDLPIVENFCYRLWDSVRRNSDDFWNIDKWKDVYDDLWRKGEEQSDRDVRVMGAKLADGSSDKFYGVDRKFLYGYWRDCLDVKQQLFLIFVRAEPMMMGGGAIGQTPPQLGARAVALVWRNPYPGSKPYWPQNAKELHDNNAPHQTRVLFYRQFD